MPFSIRALADEVVIPEEAVEVIETGEETPAEVPAAPTETTDDSGASTDSGTTETTDTPATDPTTTDTPTEGAGNGEVVDDGTDGETEESLTDTDAETEELTEDQLNALLQESTENDGIMLLELDPEEDVDPQADSTVVTTYKYAVQIYDIGVDTVWNDTDGDGAVDDDELTTGGLTFGPAIGGNYISASKSHTVDDDGHISDTDAGTDESGNAYRCVHNDDWGSPTDTSSIIYWNSKDPHVYDKCLANNCTKSVPLTLTSENSESTKDTNGQLGYVAFYSGVTTSVTGDGPGVLVDEIARSNQRYSSNKNYTKVTWGDSQIRAVLNGNQTETSSSSCDDKVFTADTNSVVSAFPSELQKAIGKKAVRYATAYNSMASSATCYDKLWLLSNIEVFGSSLTSKYAYTGEGTQYKRMQNAGDSDRIAYCSGSTAKYWWTRSRYNSSTNASCVYNTGKINNIQLIQTDSVGLAPGFVLSTSTVDDTPEEEEGTLKYAVQIYGIGVDTVWNDTNGDGVVDNNELSTGGLTFGPAIGADYTGTSQSHTIDDDGHISGTDAGTDESGNAYRCVHHDDWQTIIENNLKDPHIYDKCLANGCTKSVELELTTENSEAVSTTSTKVFIKSNSTVTLKGDGPGILIDIIQEEARKYADKGDAGLTWANSQLRAVLNGAQTETNATYGGRDEDGNAEYTRTNSVLSAFPAELQNAIGKKAVTYATDVSTVSSAVETCYDSLWLCSAKELAFTSSSTVFTNEGTAYAWPTAVMSAKKVVQSWEVFANNDGTIGTSEAYWWTRTRTKGDATQSARVNNSGKNVGGKDVTLAKDTNVGFGPSFVLSRSDLVDLPVTGGPGRDAIYAMAVALAVLAMIGLAYRRQRIR